MIYSTGLISLIVQLIIGIIDYLAINVKTSSKDEFLKDLLKVELFVQCIEFIFYVWLIYFFSRSSQNITPFRYLDWSITTPLMLITLSGFLYYDQRKSTNEEDKLFRLTDFLSSHTGSIIKIVLLNAAMLLFGLLGEFGILNQYTSTALGFIPFLINFKYIKDEFLPSDEDKFKNALFYWFVFFWGLYGVFALTSYTVKNTGYNILDIFSKNFFGLFLAYIIWSKSESV